MSTIATTTAQPYACGQDLVTCVVLHFVQYCVHLGFHDSEGRLLAACIIMCWNDNIHTFVMCEFLYAHIHAWQRFSDVG